MTFEEALQHLKQGSIITHTGNSFYYIDGKRIVNLYFYNYISHIMTASFYSDDILCSMWRIVNQVEENNLQPYIIRISANLLAREVDND